MDNSWVFDLETRIFSIVSVKVSRKLKEKYPNIFFTTTSSPKDIITKFPTVYIHEMPGTEYGITKERDKINGISYAMQIEVTTNVSQKEAKTVLKEVAFAFKEMGFEINSFPEASNGTSYYRSIMRVKRNIGSKDVL